MIIEDIEEIIKTRNIPKLDDENFEELYYSLINFSNKNFSKNSLFKSLLEDGLDIPENSDIIANLFEDCQDCDNIELFELLLRYGFKINIIIYNTDLLKIAIMYGYDINNLNSDGKTVFMDALDIEAYGSVYKLIKMGCLRYDDNVIYLINHVNFENDYEEEYEIDNGEYDDDSDDNVKLLLKSVLWDKTIINRLINGKRLLQLVMDKNAKENVINFLIKNGANKNLI